MKIQEFYHHIFGTDRRYFLLFFFINALRGAVLPLTMLLTERIIDSISLTGFLAVQYALLLGVVLISDVLLYDVSNYLELVVANRLEKNVGELVLKKCAHIPYFHFENHETYERINRINDGYKEAYVGLMTSIASLARLLIMLAGIVRYLALVSPWILLALLVAVVPTFALSLYATTKEYNSWQTMYPFLHKAKYLTELITKRRNVKEARIFGYQKYIESLWTASVEKFHKAQVEANKKPRFVVGGYVILQYAMTILVLFFSFSWVAGGRITLGFYVAIAQAMWSFVGDFQYEFLFMVNGLKHERLFTKDFLRFLAIRETDEVKESTTGDVEFMQLDIKDVWFRYTVESPYVLRGVNLTLKRGEKIGLIGENGSGKTTLIKIILGLLSPETGTILLNGKEITDQNRSVLRRMMSAVSQDFTHYNLRLQESIALENPKHAEDVGRMKSIFAMLKADKDFLGSMKDGFSTYLGKDIFDGQDLSGGQWQILSIVRSIFSDKPVMILDEPTSALDPISEVNTYDLIYQTEAIPTAILVTHRLGAIVPADQIFVLKDGEIEESGAHVDLLRSDGYYAKLFNKQKSWYVIENTDKEGGLYVE